MLDMFRKTALAGIGLAFQTKEKVEELGKRIVHEANASEEEGRKFIDELMKKSGDAKASMEKFIRETIESSLSKLDIPTSERITRLEDRLAELEKQQANHSSSK